MRINELKIQTGKEFKVDAVCRINLSDGSLFSFRNCYLPPEIIETHLLNFSEHEITASEEAAFRHASACLRAEKTALRLIARAEQCCSGLKRKLEKRGHEASCVNAVMERLCDLSLLDDSRFARLWLESRMRLTRTPRRLLVSLCARGIEHDEAQNAISEVFDEEAELALIARFVKKHARKANKSEDSARSLKYLLKSEGFSVSAVKQYFNEY